MPNVQFQRAPAKTNICLPYWYCCTCTAASTDLQQLCQFRLSGALPRSTGQVPAVADWASTVASLDSMQNGYQSRKVAAHDSLQLRSRHTVRLSRCLTRRGVLQTS
jgi:hypothetical protein